MPSKSTQKRLDIQSLPEKYPKKTTEGTKMDYSEVAFPKPAKKAKKKKGWKS
jgi:hypothetical protein